MIKTPSDHLLDSLEELLPNDFEKFKFKLQNTSVEKDHSRIPRGQVQNAKPVKLANLMINHYGEENAVRLTLQVLRAINQNLLAEELDKAIGKPQDEAMYPLGHAQEGDPADGTYVHDSYRPAIGSEDLKTSGRYSPSCLSSQASLPIKNSGDVHPRSLPQCERHMKQVQLLFCEDDREPICLICSLSQEHRGHRVRPIEEAALEYKVKIQKQLEYVKELRKSGEEQRSQGDKKTAKFLKQMETQKQRIQHQIEQLYHILEQQEKFFVASFEDLNRTIGQVRETYSTQVSRDIALLDELIGELEAKQFQPEWELMQVSVSFVSRVKMVTVPKLWNTPLEVEKKIQLFYRKSEFVEKSMKYLSGRWASGGGMGGTSLLPRRLTSSLSSRPQSLQGRPQGLGGMGLIQAEEARS
uniref:Pyrin n=1 Tax=Canis lupus dingo TaxID=286419 RepID=A0A8C0LNL4_CANLU